MKSSVDDGVFFSFEDNLSTVTIFRVLFGGCNVRSKGWVIISMRGRMRCRWIRLRTHRVLLWLLVSHIGSSAIGFVSWRQLIIVRIVLVLIFLTALLILLHLSFNNRLGLGFLGLDACFFFG